VSLRTAGLVPPLDTGVTTPNVLSLAGLFEMRGLGAVADTAQVIEPTDLVNVTIVGQREGNPMDEFVVAAVSRADMAVPGSVRTPLP
jgi:hypothetical protein